MDGQTAQTIVIGMTCIGAFTWLAGLAAMLRSSREQSVRAEEASEFFDVEGVHSANTIAGSAEVDGQPEVLAAKLAERLAHNGLGPFPVIILSSNRSEIAFAAAGTNLDGSVVRSGRFRFAGLGNQTRVDYVVETSSRGRILLAVGWVSLLLGLVALVATPWLEFLYVLPNANLRAQAVQTVQMVHFLWPPFLFAFLSRQPHRMLRAQTDALVHNLPYL
jgi:hypothetical protein